MFELSKRRKLRKFNKTTSESIESLKKKNKKSEDLFYGYHELIIESLEQPVDVLWDELTKAQQVVGAIGLFTFQVNNGGVWQFLYNRTEFCFTVADAFHAIDVFTNTSYSRVLNEFVEMANRGDWAALNDKINNENLSDDERWETFKKGADLIPSHEDHDKTWMEADSRRRFFDRVNKYIDQNLGALIEVKGTPKKRKSQGTKSKPAAMKKKEAVPHFTEYLEAEYGESPTEVSVYYTGRVTLDNQPTQLFLMRFKMPNGYESIGITGKFTRHFPDAPWEEINKMYKKHHKQELVNIHHGGYLVDRALAKNPNANKIPDGLWESFVEKIQARKQSQIPVNIEFQEYFEMKGLKRVIYTGDLLYNRDTDGFPEDLDNVDVGLDGDTSFRGERNLIFHADPRYSDFGGRGSRNGPVVGKYKLYDVVGGKFKIMKDNPWGF